MRHDFNQLNKLWGGVVCVLCVVGLAVCVPVKPAGQISSTEAYEAIKPRLTPSFEPGSARFDSLFAYFQAANPELFSHMKQIKRLFVQGQDFGGITYIAGTSGVGKSYVVRNLDMFDKTVTEKISLSELFSESLPDLQSIDGDCVFNRLPGSESFDVQRFMETVDADKAFILLDDLDEVHEQTAVAVLQALEDYVAQAHTDPRHFVVFGRPESFWPWLHDSKRTPLPRVTFTPLTLLGPEYQTHGDIAFRCSDYYGFKFTKPAPQSVIDDVVAQLTRFPFLRDTIRPLSAGNFVLDDSVARIDTGTALLNTADALKQRLFEQLLARNQKSHGRPGIDHAGYLHLLRQAAALPWTHHRDLDEQGFFSVVEKDTLTFTDDKGQQHKMYARDVLNRCGLVTLDVTNRKITRYRFEPFWVQAFLASQLPEWTPLSPKPLPPQFSGIYPHLAVFNQQNECGIGAVVPWADRLWLVTYMPHGPGGSDDKLYEITSDLTQIIRPESIGGTPANRMIHRESQQLFIGPYAIDGQRNVRAIPYDTMYGRPTGNARHLFDPEHKIYYASMEEGFYEVDVNSLAVKELYPDGNRTKNRGGALLPGYHGKGLYLGQGRLIYANNGEHSSEARKRPDVPSGVLATWNGRDWTTVQRNQFTEVTGPGGLYGNPNPATDPVWSIGWDHRSLILMVLDQGQWSRYRLPKASHCYDGAHGWNTEWPRIRDIGEGDDWLMTMHGLFWSFPKSFSEGHTAGIRPRSTYLKVIGDFCRWGDQLVFGCDDSARAEFLNTRKAKGKLAGPGQSQSNLWFVEPSQLDHLGPALGRGAVWVQDGVEAGAFSDPFLFSGFEHRAAHFVHDAKSEVVFSLEVDLKGDGHWEPLQDVTVPATGYGWASFTSDQVGAWVRVSVNTGCHVTVCFSHSQPDLRATDPDDRFAGLSPLNHDDSAITLLHAGDQQTGLQVWQDKTNRYYRMGSDMKLSRVVSPEREKWMSKNVAMPERVITIEEASVLYIDEQGRRFRLPIGHSVYVKRQDLQARLRVAREVCTERDLFQAAGVFYELPARNAGGFPKIRPIATHPYMIQDYCTWRGLLVLSGLAVDKVADNPHVIRSSDGQCAVWVGAVDDLWSLGKARGKGGPWCGSEVKAHTFSDPFLMTGFDQKQLSLSHTSQEKVQFVAQVDITGEGFWVPYKQWTVEPGETFNHRFPKAFNAYWIRFQTDKDTQATALLSYD